MPTDEVIDNKDELEANEPVTGDDTDEQLPIDKGNTDEPEQETEQTGSDDGDAASSPSPDPLPDTNDDESSEAPAESEDDSDSDSDSDSTDSHGDGESVDDVADAVETEQADGDADDGAVAGVETESDSDTHPDDETAEGSKSEHDAISNGHDDAEPCDEPADEQAGDSDTDTVDESASDGDDSPDCTDTDTDTDDSEAIGDVVTDSDTHITVPIDLPNVDGDSVKPASLRDGIHSEDEDTDRKSRVPRAVKVAAGVIATVAVTAALVTSTVAVMVVEIHPNVIGGETIASQQAGGIDGSGKKISASYTVGDALNSSDSDGPEIRSWTDCWYTVASGAKSVRAEIKSAGKGSRIDLSDGTSIDVDGRYASKVGSFDAGIDIEGIAKLYGGDDSWVAIRYDASHVLVGKRVAGGEGEGE